jgi:alpha-L-arabinofuranosidase
VIYDGVWVGEKSKIANTGGIRTTLIEKMRQIKVRPMDRILQLAGRQYFLV